MTTRPAAVQTRSGDPENSEHRDLTKEELEAAIDARLEHRPVYAYVVATVRERRGVLEQRGCSPNDKGGLITLCDCKHNMRASKRIGNPDGVWIAGLTGCRATREPKRFLFYLMFAKPLASHAEMWQTLPERVRQAKSASRHRIGDVYEPVRGDLKGEAAFRSNNYRAPIRRHVHEASDVWKRDIEKEYLGRRPWLLLGEPSQSFVWTRPRISLIGPPCRPFRGHRVFDHLAEFLQRLRDEDSHS